MTRSSPPHRRTRWATAWPSVVLAALLVGSGCGVPVEDSPRALELTPAGPGSETPSRGAVTIRIHLVEGDRLKPVERSTTERSLAAILASLAEGPTPAESSAGLSTALAPESLTVEIRGAQGRSLVVVTVGEAFTSISGDDQLLAAAQLVWSVTELDRQGRVRLVNEDGALEVPTDEGLTVGPVDREDFASVAPAVPDAP